MPIYAYKCDSCGFAKDVLQKMSDAPLEVCPSCSQPSFKKQVTAAGFQLKGSGWYATDFKGSGSAPSTAVAPSNSDSSATPATPAAESAPAKAEAAPSVPSATAAPASGS
jgi:putative FmdB family regulatory protein